MSLRPILVIPDSQLRQVSHPVEHFDARLKTLVADMFETMYDAPGIGLAAVQVGVLQRVVTIDTAREGDPPKQLVLVNPSVVSVSEELSSYQEGCLSIPEYYEDVERPARVTVRYQDIEGKTQEIEADGILATCVQHEIDHLDGVLFIDHISRLKRERVVKKFTKLAKESKGAPRSFGGTPRADRRRPAGDAG